MSLKKNLLERQDLFAGQYKRILAKLELESYQRIFFHIGSLQVPLPNLSIKIQFGTPVVSKILLCDHLVMLTPHTTESNFMYKTAPTFEAHSIVIGTPVVAPLLYDIHLHNIGEKHLKELFLTLMAQKFH